MVGQVVFSKCGRDKGMVFVVVAADGEYVFLADGKLRPLNKPKKKKAKHTQPTRIFVGYEIAATKPGGVKDADIRKWLLPFFKYSPKVNDNEEVSNWQRMT